MPVFSNPTDPKRLHTLCATALIMALMAGCSGGGGITESTETPDPSIQGSFIVSPSGPLAIQGSVGGTFFPTDHDYRLENGFDIPLSWTVEVGATWLQINGPKNGTLAAGGLTSIDVELETSVASAMAPGSYATQVEFKNNIDPSVKVCSVTLTVSASLPNATSMVGINLSPLTYHSTNWPFVDIFKASRPWRLQVNGSASTNPVALTADGWVAQLNTGEAAITYMFTSAGQNYPAGQYTVRFAGEGTLEFGQDATEISSSPGEIILDVQPNSGISLRQTSTNAANPLRDIRVIMPGFESTFEDEPFHPLFLERLAPYRTLRFMDWGQINNSELVQWTDRTRPESAQQTIDTGVAVEYMIQLANKLHADPWICIPHLADANYITQCATLIRDQLDSTLVCHIEYSNEVWNWGFQQAGYASQQGLLLYPAEGLETSRHLYYSDRSVQVFDIFETVFGTSNMSRIKRVLAGQRGSTSAHTSALTWNDAYLKTDAYSIALYFGNGLAGNVSEATVAAWSVDDMLDWCESALTVQMASATNTITLATSFGLPTISYEGGQHLVGFTNATIRATYDAANRHPRMKDLYLDMLDGWQAAGGSVFTAFNSTMRINGTGRWGVLEYQNQPRVEAPKYDALMQFIER